MAGRAATLGKRPVLDPALFPAGYLLVTGGTQLLGRFHQETLVRAAMRLVAVGASALGHRLVDDRSVFLILNVTVTLGAQRTGALTQ